MSCYKCGSDYAIFKDGQDRSICKVCLEIDKKRNLMERFDLGTPVKGKSLTPEYKENLESLYDQHQAAMAINGCSKCEQLQSKNAAMRERLARLEAEVDRLKEAVKLAQNAWYNGFLPNEWYTSVTKDYESEERSGKTIGQVISALSGGRQDDL